LRKIAFICSEPDISGGFNVIFRHAMELARGGIAVAIVCKTSVTAAHVGWHPIAEMADHPNLLWLDHNEALSHRFDLAIATWWRTFFDLWKVQADRYAYFVQSIESRFYPLEARVLRAAVDATYEVPLGIITEARWIRDYFHRLHGRDAGLAPNGIDKAIFTEIGDVISPRSPGRLRVLVEGALDAAFKNVPASIRLAREGGADEIWLLTPSAADTVEGIDRVFSRIAQTQVASVYRSCDVILKLSLVEGMFGPPLELFHCGGTAIVYNVTGHDEYIVHGRNALVAERHDEAAVVRFIRQLKDFPPFLEALKANARDTSHNGRIGLPPPPSSGQRWKRRRPTRHSTAIRSVDTPGGFGRSWRTPPPPSGCCWLVSKQFTDPLPGA
jgi:O-antigen biosynthesis protein